MRPGSPSYGNDSESLQADVMRFMAIIAFCLIAILALVKNAEPALSAEADTAPPPGPEPVAAPEPPPASPALSREKPAAAPEPHPAPPPVATLTPAAPEPARPERPTPPAAVPPEPAGPAARAHVAAEEVAVEDGLILRFASDGDFLRLIARGDITVYAYRDRDVLSLDRSYRFLTAPPPGQVYELLRSSIPEMVVSALRRTRPDIHGYRWGISLPGRISGQIQRHLGRVSRGQLVINRYGEVRHVAAS